MKNLAFVLLTIFILWTGCTGSKPDSQTLQGTWKPVEGVLSGQTFPQAALNTVTLEIGDGTYKATVVGEQPDEGTWTIDTGAEPKTMLITGVTGANQGKSIPAIYEIKDDSLRVCYDLSGQKPPAAFESAPGTMLYLVTYRRSETTAKEE